MPKEKLALIVGAGSGLSACLTQRFLSEDMQVVLAARNTHKLSTLCNHTKATAYRCDATNQNEVELLFSKINKHFGDPDVVIYNASSRVRGPITEIKPEQVLQALTTSCFGGFLVAQQAAKRMVPRGKGAIFFTGASASIKGYPKSAAFAMGKFGLRGLAQSLARELHPKKIHVGHFIIDGRIKKKLDEASADAELNDRSLDPDAIADVYWQFLQQPSNAWAWEIELRPNGEVF